MLFNDSEPIGVRKSETEASEIVLSAHERRYVARGNACTWGVLSRGGTSIIQVGGVTHGLCTEPSLSRLRLHCWKHESRDDPQDT